MLGYCEFLRSLRFFAAVTNSVLPLRLCVFVWDFFVLPFLGALNGSGERLSLAG